MRSCMRSGLYVLVYVIRTFTSTEEERTYVVYWPEDTTWNDDAVSTVQCNSLRVMFMRYESYGSVLRDFLFAKLCDQFVHVCLTIQNNVLYHSTQKMMTVFSTLRLQK
ncbi:hypothetical protein EDB86DRAFT_2878568 [Lactarius hatsudake]|nr:hypothetical protein EDB86DRAFT_2878568 [Lactarius hatsudake]